MIEKYLYTYNTYVRQKYGKRVSRICFDLNIPCPWNRCTYCNHQSFVPNNAVVINDNDNWMDNYNAVVAYMRKRYKTNLFFAYFQSNTSTYGDPEMLFNNYYKASHIDNVAGLIISTRPDYLDEEKVELILKAVPEEMDEIWIELGLQSVHEHSLDVLQRGHTADQYFKAIEMIEKIGKGRIRVAPHLIMGIPGERDEDFIASVTESIAPDCVKGLKIHHLQIYKETELSKVYADKSFDLLTAEGYIELFARTLQYIPEDIVLFRVFTTSPGDYLIAPKWGMTTQNLLKKLELYLKEHKITQGSLLK